MYSNYPYFRRDSMLPVTVLGIIFTLTFILTLVTTIICIKRLHQSKERLNHYSDGLISSYPDHCHHNSRLDARKVLQNYQLNVYDGIGARNKPHPQSQPVPFLPHKNVVLNHQSTFLRRNIENPDTLIKRSDLKICYFE